MDTSESTPAENNTPQAPPPVSDPLAENLSDSPKATTDDPVDLNLKNESKFRENLYRLIISQLFYDGYQHIAVGLSGSVQVFFLNLLD